MVSSGSDCTVRVWEHADSYDGFDSYDNTSSDDVPDSLPAAVKLVHKSELCLLLSVAAVSSNDWIVDYTKPPLDIAYQLLEHDNNWQPILAVACGNGYAVLNCLPFSHSSPMIS
jgi:hypothetical protein